MGCSLSNYSVWALGRPPPDNSTNATNAATGTLIVGGGASVGLDFYVGDDLVVTDAGSFGGNVDITGTLDVTNDFAINGTKFTVASSTGNTIVQGTFQVDGNAQIGNAGSDSHTIDGTVQLDGDNSRILLKGKHDLGLHEYLSHTDTFTTYQPSSFKCNKVSAKNRANLDGGWCTSQFRLEYCNVNIIF